MKFWVCCKRSIASKARPSSWSLTIRTPRRARRERFISTRASSRPRNRNEIPLSRLEQSEAQETSDRADANVDSCRLCLVQFVKRAQTRAHGRRAYGRRQPSGRAPSRFVHPTFAARLSGTDGSDSGRLCDLPHDLVWRHLPGSEEPVRHLSRRAGIVSADEPRNHPAGKPEGSVAQDPRRSDSGPAAGGAVQLEDW